MTILRRSLLGLLFGLGLIRAAAYLAYAAACLPSPLEAYYLEAKMVLLAYRAEAGVTLYPEWRDYPHVADFFAPAYFGAVGLIGRALGSDIAGLFRIGRAVSFGSGLLTSLAVGVVAARRYGRMAGIAGGIVSLGTAPMFGFSVMVRPDIPAEFLGVLGFFLAGAHSVKVRALGGLVLVLAMLTKQTAAIYLVAASLAWALEGDWRRGLRLGLGASIALGAVVGLVTLRVEPNFAACLTAEGKTPWDLWALKETFRRICLMSPDTLILPLLGIGLWLSGVTGRREARPAVLAAILLAACVVTSAKRGSDLNYYLGLRAVEGLAVGALCRAWAASTRRARSAALATLTLLVCLALAPGTFFATTAAQVEWSKARFFEETRGREVVDFYRAACTMASDPQSRLLTDVGIIDLYKGERAEFGDPWLFRMLAETGRVDPVEMRRRVDEQYYNLIITSSELERPTYETYAFGLPMSLVERARARYVRVDTRAGLFLYERRPMANPSREPGAATGPMPRADRP